MNSNLTLERDDAFGTIKTLSFQQSETISKLDEINSENEDLKKSFSQAGKALDEAVHEKESVEIELQVPNPNPHH